jgi:hypothetical protein
VRWLTTLPNASVLLLLLQGVFQGINAVLIPAL